MKTIPFIFLLFLVVSCASEKPKFSPAKVCSQESVRYLKHPRNNQKHYISSPNLNYKMSSTKESMQLCYEDFKNRTGHNDDFNTCLVVGVDEYGVMDFYNFSSEEAKLDKKFMNCAAQVMGQVDFSSFGWNYILVQSYQFYYE